LRFVIENKYFQKIKFLIFSERKTKKTTKRKINKNKITSLKNKENVKNIKK